MYLYLVEHICGASSLSLVEAQKKETIPGAGVSKIDTMVREKYISKKATFPLTKR
jgi:hypothetical protein